MTGNGIDERPASVKIVSGAGELWARDPSYPEDCKTPEDYRKKVISNSNQDKQRKGSSQNNSGTIISGTVLSLLGMCCTAMGCACQYSKCDKNPTEPEQTSSPNSGTDDQVEIPSEQPN